MEVIEAQTVTLKTLIGAMALTWTAGTGITVWAANQENRLSNLEEKQAETKDERTKLNDSIEELTDAVQTLTTSTLLLKQRIEIERELITAGAEVVEER